jgi:hypothetical protein
MPKVQSKPTTFDPKTTARMLAAVKREAQAPAQRTGVGPVAQPGSSR